MREPADDAVSRYAFAAAAAAPLIRLQDPTREDRAVGLKPLPGDFEAEFIETAERGQVRAGEAALEGSVGHVEVFRWAV